MKASKMRYGLNRGFRWELARGILHGLLFTALLVGLAAPAPQPVKAASIPTFNIVQVVKDDKVTIRTYNFPAGQLFTV
ncbi:MAG: hypothetical protein U1B80_02770, partial [Anaerolineaceae bacterium]|nr:hypothetical protein [Anaerolineaceae bacterium]